MKSAPPSQISLGPRQILAILLPYSWHHIKEQLFVVAPVCFYLVLFQLLLLGTGIERAGVITGGTVLVVFGLIFFLEAVRIGLGPLGEIIGDTLPRKASLPVVLAFAFALGVVGAFGEPVIGSLQIAGAGVDPAKAPILHALLVGRPLLLALTIAVAVGIAVLLGTMRIVFGWSLKPLVLTLVGTSITLTLVASRDPRLASAVGLAWDTGAVIVGPVLCPLVLALGLGVSRATGRADSGMAGFGMVGMISVLPIAIVVLLTFILGGLDLAPAAVAGAATGHHEPVAHGSLAMDALGLSLRATVPIFVFLILFLRFKLKERGLPPTQTALSFVFAVLGLFLFNLGLVLGLGDLGDQVGTHLPRAFLPAGASLFPGELGKVVVVLFGVVLGYGATLAEPAFNVLGAQVEEVTQGAFKKWLFSQAVALGVGIGAGMGMLSLVYQVDLLYLLLPPYALLFILTLLSEEKYANIAWDGGAVTTGPVTVPLKIAIGIKLSHATGFAEGFGILALASAYPVLNILLIGQYVKWRQRTRQAPGVSHSRRSVS